MKILVFNIPIKKHLISSLPLSNDTIDSVLRHGKVGRAKDLSAPPLMIWKISRYLHINMGHYIYNLIQRK